MGRARVRQEGMQIVLRIVACVTRESSDPGVRAADARTTVCVEGALSITRVNWCGGAADWKLSKTALTVKVSDPGLTGTPERPPDGVMYDAVRESSRMKRGGEARRRIDSKLSVVEVIDDRVRQRGHPFDSHRARRRDYRRRLLDRAGNARPSRHRGRRHRHGVARPTSRGRGHNDLQRATGVGVGDVIGLAAVEGCTWTR